MKIHRSYSRLIALFAASLILAGTAIDGRSLGREAISIVRSRELPVTASISDVPITVPRSRPQRRAQTRSRPVATGNWGGSGVKVVVGKNTVKIEYDCADGEINRRLKIDKKGNFRVDGTHKRGTFGPILIGHELKKEPARYEGRITGKVMRFTVTLIETNEVIGEFTATRGQTGKIRRCY